MKKRNHVLIAATVCGALIAASTGGVLAADTQANSQSGLKLNRRTPDDKKQLHPDEMLSDLRDLRLSLGQVKQQAVNLFLESTRKVIPVTDPVVPSSPTEIDSSMFHPEFKYLPPRKEWLVFYVNTLEPIMQMLMDDIHDVDTNGRNYPPELEAKTDPLWKSWRSEVDHMRASLDKVQELIEPESGTNKSLTDAAVALFDKAKVLEKTRIEVYEILQKHYLADDKAAKK